MKMIYDDREYEVKLKRPTKKIINAIASMKDDGEEDTDFLDLMVKSVDGLPIDDVDDDIQWAAMFAAMEVFKRLTAKKSEPNGAGPQ